MVKRNNRQDYTPIENSTSVTISAVSLGYSSKKIFHCSRQAKDLIMQVLLLGSDTVMSAEFVRELSWYHSI